MSSVDISGTRAFQCRPHQLHHLTSSPRILTTDTLWLSLIVSSHSSYSWYSAWYSLLHSKSLLAILWLANNAETSHSWFPSTTIPAMEADSSTTPLGSSIDKNCREQLILYLLDHIVEIVNTFAWLWIRFYIVYRTASLVVDDLMKPIVICLAKKAYR